MASYKFVFLIGILNLTIPFFGIPTSYKNIAFIALGSITLLYALVIRAIIKEKRAGLVTEARSSKEEYEQYRVPTTYDEEQTISDVVEMSDEELAPRTSRIVVSDVRPKRRGRKPKTQVIEEIYE